jgi:hypothetical protein
MTNAEVFLAHLPALQALGNLQTAREYRKALKAKAPSDIVPLLEAATNIYHNRELEQFLKAREKKYFQKQKVGLAELANRKKNFKVKLDILLRLGLPFVRYILPPIERYFESP